MQNEEHALAETAAGDVAMPAPDDVVLRDIALPDIRTAEEVRTDDGAQNEDGDEAREVPNPSGSAPRASETQAVQGAPEGAAPDMVGTSLPESVPVAAEAADSALVSPGLPQSLPVVAGRVYTKEDRLRAKEKKREQMEAGLAAIMTYVMEKEAALMGAGIVDVGSDIVGISNDEVEVCIGVSDTTAGKYLKELVARGLLHKRGSGRGTKYMLH